MRYSSFEAFASANVRPLLRLGIALSGSLADAEDLSQEAMLKAHAQWRMVRRADNPDAYLRRIAINCFISERRRPVVSSVPLDTLSDAQHPRSTGAPQFEERDVLFAVIAGLPRRQRTALVLRHYCGLETAEIADEMGVGESSVRSAIARALATLREQLDTV